jgi:hypothetical protein
MSSIYFHFSDGSRERVSGSERAHMGILTGDMARSVLSFVQNGPHWLQGLLPDKSHWKNGAFDEQQAKYALSSFDGDILNLNGECYDVWQTVLNTAMTLGSTPVKLCCRIHACCEIWGRVEGPNRKWFADLCEDARKALIFRDDMGWEETIAAIRNGDDSPVVMSYSVCEQFPASGLFKFDSDDESEEWEEKDYSERWSECVESLRKGWPEIKPEDFDTFRFGKGVDLLQLEQMAKAKK